MEHYPNILLIAGNGRNSGKTSFACSVIDKFSKDGFKIISVKISPNVHEIQNEKEIITSNKDFLLLETKDVNPGKDSSRMLKAGAKKSYYIQSKDEHLAIVFNKLKQKLNKNDVIIIESGGLRNIINPGLFFMLNKQGVKTIKPKTEIIKNKVDKWIEFDGSGFNFAFENLIFENGSWKIQE